MKFVKLTRPSGTEVYVNMDYVREILPSDHGATLVTTVLNDRHTYPGTGTEIFTYEEIRVKEYPEDVAERANEESYDFMEVDPSEDR